MILFCVAIIKEIRIRIEKFTLPYNEAFKFDFLTQTGHIVLLKWEEALCLSVYKFIKIRQCV